MDERTQSYISILGSSLSPPIVALLDRLYRSPYMGTTDVQSSSFEHGHSAAVCLLLAVLLESFVVRAREITHRPAKGSLRSAFNFLKVTYPEVPELEEIRDVFVIRDVVAHNHVWTATVSVESSRWIEVSSIALDDLAGDAKYEKSVDPKGRRTRALALNTLPTKLERSDVAKVLAVVVRTLRFLDSEESGRLGVGGLRGDFLGEDLHLWEIEERVRTLR